MLKSRPVRSELSTASWRRTRAIVKRRDGNRCVACGSDGWIPAHVPGLVGGFPADTA